MLNLKLWSVCQIGKWGWCNTIFVKIDNGTVWASKFYDRQPHRLVMVALWTIFRARGLTKQINTLYMYDYWYVIFSWTWTVLCFCWAKRLRKMTLVIRKRPQNSTQRQWKCSLKLQVFILYVYYIYIYILYYILCF